MITLNIRYKKDTKHTIQESQNTYLFRNNQKLSQVQVACYQSQLLAGFQTQNILLCCQAELK